MGRHQQQEDREEEAWTLTKQALVQEAAKTLFNGTLENQIQAARDIRKLSKTSVKTRANFAAAGVIQPLVSMLNLPNAEAKEASLLALLNLAVRNERNKVRIVKAGAVPMLVELLKSENPSIRESTTAAILTLSASALNKPSIASSGATPHLVEILSSGSLQGKVDAVTALYNLTTCTENLSPLLAPQAVPPLLMLLKECKKYSKFAEKATALIELLSSSDEGLSAISRVENGILTLVETIEDGSLQSTEHSVGVLLKLCQSSREKYRELILKEGAIPGLLQLTVHGSPKAQQRARALLELLRENPTPKTLESSVLESLVFNIATQVDGAEKAAETAKKLLQEMVQRSMELSLSSLQERASSSDTSSSELPSKFEVELEPEL
ncbi:hypothetical protein AMTRI_Chr10g232370 [Amborella trichopoda]|uniref:U-box domain-containing protein n=1 Tax=Amborella trichopoda TaxID=13333 RepID=U5DAG3_AMBTC|nr:U-box domain-containing protein 3 [Amborella trichopoda]ERN19200.1 hypothetical protein AMTR_s00061p00185790 [Amborella trichopoda]|eukprot:XP_006857733.1 U-box domain-containing protein 3 [Amborella trichopoda]